MSDIRSRDEDGGRPRSGAPAEIALSVIVPLYNEEANVRPLSDAIRSALEPTGISYEVLLVDDGSSDATLEAAAALPAAHPEVRVVKLRRNYGQTAAMAAGIEHARGRVLVTMDGDLQNDPLDIPRFLAAMEEGYDIVVGWRHDRKDKLWTRKVPSRIANALIGRVTGVPIRDNGCSLKAYRAEVIKKIPLYSEMHRFIPAMASLAGPRLAEIKVRHHARRFGASKYGLSRVYRVLLDLLAVKTIIGFASRPAGWFALLAFPALLISGASLGASMYRMLALEQPFSTPIAGIGVLFGALAFFLMMTGMIGELVYKTGDAREDRMSMLTAQKLTGLGMRPVYVPAGHDDLGDDDVVRGDGHRDDPDDRDGRELRGASARSAERGDGAGADPARPASSKRDETWPLAATAAFIDEAKKTI